MVQIPSKALTLAAFLELPETKPASEYVDGQIIQKPMPQGKHSAIQGEFVPAINGIVKPQRIARAFPELRCTFGDRSIVPDIVVFVWERIPRDENGEVSNTFAIAPDWTIEIGSIGVTGRWRQKEADRMHSTRTETLYSHAQPEPHVSDRRCQMLRDGAPNALESRCLLP